MFFTNKKEDARGRDVGEGILNFDISGEFVKFYNYPLLKEIKARIKDLKRGKSRESQKYLQEYLKGEINLLIMMGHMGKQNMIVSLLQVWAEVWENEFLGEEQRCEVAEGLLQAVALTWDLRNETVKNGYKKEWNQNPQWKKVYDENLRLGKSFNRKFQGRGVA